MKMNGGYSVGRLVGELVVVLGPFGDQSKIK